MVENCCAQCAKFFPEEKPENIQKLGKDVFFNEDESQKEVSDAGLIFGLLMSSDYGKRRCSMRDSAMGASTCQVPEEFEPKEDEN